MKHALHRSTLGALLALLALALLPACSTLDFGQGSNEPAAGATTPMTYFPTKFHDFEAPTELSLERDKTLFINTGSFNGGIVYLTGRLKVDSLTDFFIHSMQKNGWKLTGEAQYKNVLLSFAKPGKVCMITIYEGELGTSTKVYAYITEDATGGGAGGSGAPGYGNGPGSSPSGYGGGY